jgi:hypothetical protein
MDSSTAEYYAAQIVELSQNIAEQDFHFGPAEDKLRLIRHYAEALRDAASE